VANIKSQIKRNKQNEKARLRNKAVRSELRTRVKRAESAVGTENADAAVRTAVSKIDKAATTGVIHKNAAARKKSRLMKRLARAS
jgi:small subunit ribosomal protein S20